MWTFFCYSPQSRLLVLLTVDAIFRWMFYRTTMTSELFLFTFQKSLIEPKMFVVFFLLESRIRKQSTYIKIENDTYVLFALNCVHACVRGESLKFWCWFFVCLVCLFRQAFDIWYSIRKKIQMKTKKPPLSIITSFPVKAGRLIGKWKSKNDFIANSPLCKH